MKAPVGPARPRARLPSVVACLRRPVAGGDREAEEPMSRLYPYQLHRCVYDFIRAGQVSSGSAQAHDASRYNLTDEQRRAFEERDVAALYQLGLHPVLLNAFCRAVGFSRDEYRKVLEPLGEPEKRRGRWQK
jgi:hypothetical protein